MLIRSISEIYPLGLVHVIKASVHASLLLPHPLLSVRYLWAFCHSLELKQIYPWAELHSSSDHVRSWQTSAHLSECFIWPPWSAMTYCSTHPFQDSSVNLCCCFPALSWWIFPWSASNYLWKWICFDVLSSGKMQIKRWIVDFDALRERSKDSLYNKATLPWIPLYCFFSPLNFFLLVVFCTYVDCEMCLLGTLTLESHVPRCQYIMTG